MKLYILLAHPNTKSYNGTLADAYEAEAIKKGHTVRRQNLGELQFDPILRKGYGTAQTLEPDLQQAQDNLRWCDRWVIIYPVWWGSVPALLKGFLDRTLLPGFAYKYKPKGSYWDKLLSGKSAHLVTTSDGPWWWLWLSYRNSDTNMMKKAVLEFCGIRPVKTTRIDRVRLLDETQLAQRRRQLCEEVG